jgi:DNA-binding MarR family transcriptional regulator
LAALPILALSSCPMARDDSVFLSPLHLLHRAGQRADGLFARHIGDLQLTPRQFMLLQAVSEADGLSQTAIMTATGIDRSSTADLVRRMVKSGYLRRRRSKRDARFYAVRLTPRGRQILAMGRQAARRANELLLSDVAIDRRHVVLEALEIMAAATD